MSAVCPNCKAKLSCSCKRRTASDGTKACTNCLSRYEADLKKKSSIENDSQNTAPSSVTVIYNGPSFK